LLCRDDRFFRPEWMRRIVKERLGIVPDEIDVVRAGLAGYQIPERIRERMQGFGR
jgi:hypothetical protein